MGCHTWFSVPFVQGEEEIYKLAQQYVDTSPHFQPGGYKEMYQLAIDNKLPGVVKELAGLIDDCSSYDDSWTLYMGVEEFALRQYNKENNTNLARYKDWELVESLNLESYSDEPRIGGYPEHVIRTYDQMVEFMKTGFDNNEGQHFDFYYQEDRKENFMQGIRNFFYRHPDGIITFG